MTGTTMQPMRPSASRRPRWSAPVAVVVIAVAGLVLSQLLRVLEVPSHVERVLFENPTAYDLDVEVSDGRRDSWVGMGTAVGGAITKMEKILDQGDTWTFRFTGQGEAGGEVQLTRRQLERDGWKVTIPEEIGHTLEARGVLPPP